MPHPRASVHPSRGPHNSLWYLYRDVGFLRVIWNTAWIVLARWSPSFRLKRWMLRRTGARIGKHCAIGFESTLDILFPQDITIEDDVIIGYATVLLCHAYTRRSYQRGPVTVREGASIGAGCTVLPGVTVGRDAVVGAGSVVTRDVPDGEFWAGVPARRVRTRYGEAA